jgi:uracil-DNA glycosylase family 4
VQQLCKVFERQHEAGLKHDPERVVRVLVPDALDSKLMLVGQSLGQHTQRRSGLPYIFPGGPPYTLSDGGERLDELLGRFGYTIVPGIAGRQYVHHTDLVPYYPGPARGGGGDRAPSRAEIREHLADVQREIEIIAPRIVIALGRLAAVTLARTYLGERARSLAALVGREEPFRVGGDEAVLLFTYHPSGARR